MLQNFKLKLYTTPNNLIQLAGIQLYHHGTFMLAMPQYTYSAIPFTLIGGNEVAPVYIAEGTNLCIKTNNCHDE